MLHYEFGSYEPPYEDHIEAVASYVQSKVLKSHDKDDAMRVAKFICTNFDTCDNEEFSELIMEAEYFEDDAKEANEENWEGINEYRSV